MRNAVYSNRFKVHLHEVDASGKARISTILNYFQNSSSEQSASLGFAVTDLMKRGLTWVVSRYHLTILRYPAWKESVVVNTWRAGLSGNFALREFEVSFRGEAFYGDTVLSLSEKVDGIPSPLFIHQIVRPEDGKELARPRTSWSSTL